MGTCEGSAGCTGAASGFGDTEELSASIDRMRFVAVKPSQIGILTEAGDKAQL